MAYAEQLIKLVGETITITFDFSDQMQFEETLDPPLIVSTVVTVFSGIDYSPSSILVGSTTVSGKTTSQTITAGMAGVIYTITGHAVGSSTGTVYRVVKRLAILADDGSFVSSSAPVLSGTLSDGVVGAAYSSNLTISGGYAPYSPVGLIAGAPAWMGFTVNDNLLVCAGTPDESTATSYTFSPQILDAALTSATSSQAIDITRITISGNLGDGAVGDSVSFQYAAANGTAPYTFDTTITGLPAGTSISAAGLVTGTYTTAATNIWTVRAVDVNNIPATLLDGNDVITVEWIATFTNTDGDTLEISAGTSGWSNPPFGVTGWSPGIGTSSAKNGDEIVLFYQGTAMHSISPSTYTATLTAGFVAGHGLVYVQGYWFAANTGGTMRSSDGESFPIPVGSISSNSIGALPTRVFAVRHAGDPGICYTTDNPTAAAPTWVNRGVLPNAFNPSAQVRFATDNISIVSLLIPEYSGSNMIAHILKANNPLSLTTITWTEVSNPFPTIVGVTDTTYAYYAPAQQLFIYIFYNRLAYGPDPTSLTLSSHVFPQSPTHIASSDSKFLVCGASMLESSTDLETWTVESLGISADIFAVVSRPS